MNDVFSRHVDLLRQALSAGQARRAWSPFAQGLRSGIADHARLREGLAAYRDAQFYLDQPAVAGRVGDECSPYGFALNVTYPACPPEVLVATAGQAMTTWARIGVEARVGLCAEMLVRMHEGAETLTAAVTHATGQAPAVALYVGVVQALARGLESVATAWRTMHVAKPDVAVDLPSGNGELMLHNHYAISPRGVAALVGGDVAPTWLALPALFANLATGNGVVVIPHPNAILPLALIVSTCRQVLKEHGIDQNLVSLLVGASQDALVRNMVARDDVRIVDGPRLPAAMTAQHAAVFRQDRALGCALVDSCDDYASMLRYLAMACVLDSGHLPFGIRAVFVPSSGVATPDGIVAVDAFGRDLAASFGRLVDEPGRAASILRAGGAGDNDNPDHAAWETVHPARSVDHPEWPGVRLTVPALVRCGLSQVTRAAALAESPVVLLVEAPTALLAVSAIEEAMRALGGHEILLYSQNGTLQSAVADCADRVDALASFNLPMAPAQAMPYIVPSAFADFATLGSGHARSVLVDDRYVANRFSLTQVRQVRRR